MEVEGFFRTRRFNHEFSKVVLQLVFIAEAVLQRLEVIVFQTFPPKLWKRHVDDTFVIINTDKLSDFDMALNNALP